MADSINIYFSIPVWSVLKKGRNQWDKEAIAELPELTEAKEMHRPS